MNNLNELKANELVEKIHHKMYGSILPTDLAEHEREFGLECFKLGHDSRDVEISSNCKKCRKHNQIVNFGIDPELKPYDNKQKKLSEAIK